jgi:hypothetical protein
MVIPNSGEALMSRSNPHPATADQREQRGRRMIRETEAFLNRRVNGVHVLRHRHEPARDDRTDPRRPVVTKRVNNEPKAPNPTAPRVNTLVRAPADEHGHLNETLLDQWGVHLSRLIDMPHRGHVLLDLVEVASMTERFVQVYEWFRRNLARQDRLVVLQTGMGCLENPGPDDVPKLIKVTRCE